jgi:predicted dehydrogenase
VTGHSRGVTTGERRSVDTDDIGAFAGRFANGAIGEFRFSRIATGHCNSPAFDLIGSRGSVAFDMERAAEFGIFELAEDEALSGFRRVVASPTTRTTPTSWPYPWQALATVMPRHTWPRRTSSYEQWQMAPVYTGL